MIENEQQAELVREIAGPLSRATVWMRALALISIVSGVLLFIAFCASAGYAKNRMSSQELIIVGAACIGTVVGGVLLIWLGTLLYASVRAQEQARRTGQKEDLLASLEALRQYFTAMGVLSVVGLLLQLTVAWWLYFR